MQYYSLKFFDVRSICATTNGHVICGEVSISSGEQSGELPIAESIYQGVEKGLLQKIQVGVEEVKEQRGNLREDKAPGPDNVQPRVLMEVAE